MIRSLFFVSSIFLAPITPMALAQVEDYLPITQEMLLNPSPSSLSDLILLF